jgi:hypothetical protein
MHLDIVYISVYRKYSLRSKIVVVLALDFYVYIYIDNY